MREFWTYSAMRLLMLIATFAVVAGIWILAAGELNWFYALIVSFLISGIASYVLLDRQRQALAGKVEKRASRRVESMRSKEDRD